MNAFKIKDEILDDGPSNLSATLNDDFPDDVHFDDFNDFGGADLEATNIKQEIKKEPLRNPFLEDDHDTTLEVREINIKDARTPHQYVNDTSKQEKATVVKKSEHENRQSWMTVDNNLNSAAFDTKEPEVVVIDVQGSTILEENGNLRMYWIDACEVRGVVYLFGKVSDIE